MIVISDSSDDRYGFAERFVNCSDEELIGAYNHEVGVTVWVSARGEFLYHLRREFLQRKWDASLFIDGEGMFMNVRIRLENGKLVKA